MAVLADVNSTAAKLEAMQQAARAHNVELSIYRVARAEEIASAIDTAHEWGATALNIFAGVFLWANRQLIFDRAAALSARQQSGSQDRGIRPSKATLESLCETCGFFYPTSTRTLALYDRCRKKKPLPRDAASSDRVGVSL